MRILAISGSLRRDSLNSALLAAAAAVSPPDLEFVTWRGLGGLPAFDEDIDIVPATVVDLRREIADADAVLIATPEYNASVPGALKNALDWVSRPHATNVLRGKPVSVIGASQGLFGAVWAQAELRRTLSTIGASVIDGELPVPSAHDAFDANGRLRDPELASTLESIVRRLREQALDRATSRPERLRA